MDNVQIFLWVGLGLLVVGSGYLIAEGIKVNKLFAESIIGRLVRTLVIVLLIELYSLGIVCIAFLRFYPKGTVVLLPIVVLWVISLIFSIFTVRSTKSQVVGLTK